MPVSNLLKASTGWCPIPTRFLKKFKKKMLNPEFPVLWITMLVHSLVLLIAPLHRPLH